MLLLLTKVVFFLPFSAKKINLKNTWDRHFLTNPMRSRHVFLTHNPKLQVQPVCKQFEFQCHVYGPDAIPTHSDCAGHPPPHHLISFFFPRTSESKPLTLLDLATISVRTIYGVFSGHLDAGKFIDLLSADRTVINRFYFRFALKISLL